jgi:uncharacterized protein YjbI with pentapeptide repeats
LRYVPLRNAVLSGVDFSGADLRGADFRGAYVGGASFELANLRDADFRGLETLLPEARGLVAFYGACVSGARFNAARVL